MKVSFLILYLQQRVSFNPANGWSTLVPNLKSTSVLPSQANTLAKATLVIDFVIAELAAAQEAPLRYFNPSLDEYVI